MPALTDHRADCTGSDVVECSAVQDLPSTMHVSGWYALRVPVMSKSYTLERGIVIELVLEVSL